MTRVRRLTRDFIRPDAQHRFDQLLAALNDDALRLIDQISAGDGFDIIDSCQVVSPSEGDLCFVLADDFLRLPH